MDDPARALQTAESSLRLAVRAVLGDDWITHVTDAEKLEAKREEEAKRRDGVVVADDLLSFTEFYTLKTLILKQWDRFQPVFDDKKRTEVWLGVIEDVRNSIAHSRQLVDHERYLIAGASGQLRNQVTLYRQSVESANSHYAYIESVTDNHGLTGSPGDVLFLVIDDALRVEVGETLTFDCVGGDPRGRELEWLLHTGFGDTVLARAYGATATLTYAITEDDVGERFSRSIALRTKGGKYRRSSLMDGTDYDDISTFGYAVNPPPD